MKRNESIAKNKKESHGGKIKIVFSHIKRKRIEDVGYRKKSDKKPS